MPPKKITKSAVPARGFQTGAVQLYLGAKETASQLTYERLMAEYDALRDAIKGMQGLPKTKARAAKIEGLKSKADALRRQARKHKMV